MGKIDHEMFNIPQWLPPDVKIDVKLQLPLSNFICEFTNGKILSKLVLDSIKSASAIGSETNSPFKLDMFELLSLVCKVNGILLYNLSFKKSYRTLHELTM